MRSVTIVVTSFAPVPLQMNGQTLPAQHEFAQLGCIHNVDGMGLSRFIDEHPPCHTYHPIRAPITRKHELSAAGKFAIHQ